MVKVENPEEHDKKLFGWRCDCGSSNRDTRWSETRAKAEKKARRHIYREGSCDIYERGGAPEIEVFEV